LKSLLGGSSPFLRRYDAMTAYTGANVRSTGGYWELSGPVPLNQTATCRACRVSMPRGESVMCRDGRKLRFFYHVRCFTGDADPRTQEHRYNNCVRRKIQCGVTLPHTVQTVLFMSQLRATYAVHLKREKTTTARQLPKCRHWRARGRRATRMDACCHEQFLRRQPPGLCDSDTVNVCMYAGMHFCVLY
jgi:hypothetical protein